MFRFANAFQTKVNASWSNWAGTVKCQTEGLFYPATEEALVTLVQQAAEQGKTIRVMGEGHSFSPLLETEVYIVSLRHLSGLIAVDKEAKVATAWAGMSIKNCNQALYEQGMAMINLGDIDVQSLAGATATGTHGTGTAFGNLSSEIVGFRLLTADGQLLNCSAKEHPTIFAAGRISLGALGIITQITFNIVPAYKLEYTSAAGQFEETMPQIEQYNQENRNFEYYYFPYSDILQLKTSNKTDKPIKHNAVLAYVNDVVMENGIFGAALKLGGLFPKLTKTISRSFAKTFPKGTTIHYSHKVYATVRQVRFKEMEYNIPVEHFDACMRAVKARIEEREYVVCFPVECRFVKGDDCWLSPAYQRDSAYIAVHTIPSMPHDPYFEEMEAIFKRYQGRPHWGKMHRRVAADLAPVYERWEDFLALRARLDPQGLFLNPYLKKLFGLV
ncbi:MAG: D-arabinono-1,4-lactone oxidase [Aureispira sp.]